MNKGPMGRIRSILTEPAEKFLIPLFKGLMIFHSFIMTGIPSEQAERYKESESLSDTEIESPGTFAGFRIQFESVIKSKQKVGSSHPDTGTGGTSHIRRIEIGNPGIYIADIQKTNPLEYTLYRKSQLIIEDKNRFSADRIPEFVFRSDGILLETADRGSSAGEETLAFRKRLAAESSGKTDPNAARVKKTGPFDAPAERHLCGS